MMDGQGDAYNPRGVELLCDIVRGQAASLPCPGCDEALDDVDIDIREVVDDQITLDLTCRCCETRFPVRAAPASEGGVAVVR
jgi:hypothetical protein